MSARNGGPAFPVARVSINAVDVQDGAETYSGGMSLRDYFAANAMAAMVGAFHPFRVDGKIADGCEAYALGAYQFADAMLKARES